MPNTVQRQFIIAQSKYVVMATVRNLLTAALGRVICLAVAATMDVFKGLQKIHFYVDSISR